MGKGKLLNAKASSRVLECVHETLSKLEALHPITELDLVLFPSFNLTHPRWFRTGMCHSANAVEISFNPNHDLFDSRLEVELPPLILHEVHHALRYRHFDQWTIGENLILEGLARCAEGVLGDVPMDYNPQLPQDKLKELCTKAANEMDITDPEKFYWIWESYSNDHVSNMYHVGYWFAQTALENLNKNAFTVISHSYQSLMSTGREAMLNA